MTKFILNSMLLIVFLSLNNFAQDTKVLLEQVKSLFETQKFDEAVTKLNSIIEREPNNEDALTFRARAFIILKKVPEAAVDADKVLAMNPKNTYALNVRGMVKGANKDFNGAIADFTQALTIDPTFYRSYYQRARAKIFLKKSLNEVLADYDAFLKLNEDLDIMAEAGYYCTDNDGGYQTCSAYFTRIKAKDPNSAVGYYGYALSYLNDYSKISDKSIFKGEILSNLRKAVELDSKNANIPHQLGRFYLNLEDYDNAITALSQAISLNPKRAWTYVMRADSYRLKKDYDNAIADYTKGIELEPEYKWAYEYRAKTRYQKWRDPNQKDKPELEFYTAMNKDFINWIEFNPNNYEVYKEFDSYNLPMWSDKGDFYKKQIAANPKNVCARYFLLQGRTYFEKREDWDALINNYDGKNGSKCAGEAALWIGRNFSEGDGYRGIASNPTKAQEYYDLVLKYDPQNPYVQNWIAKLPKELKGTPASGDSETSVSTQQKQSGASYERIKRAIDAYDTAHQKVEGHVKAYVDAENKLAKAGNGAFLMKGTQLNSIKAKDAAISEIESLLEKHGKYLPKELLNHILDDYEQVGGTRNFDYLLNN